MLLLERTSIMHVCIYVSFFVGMFHCLKYSKEILDENLLEMFFFRMRQEVYFTAR